jgi:hypothetical protein
MTTVRPPTAMHTAAAVRAAREWVGQRPGVTAVTVGGEGGALVLDVWMSGDVPGARSQIPTYVHGIAVRVFVLRSAAPS